MKESFQCWTSLLPADSDSDFSVRHFRKKTHYTYCTRERSTDQGAGDFKKKKRPIIIAT